MSGQIIVLLFGLVSSQSSVSPAVSEVGGEATLSWIIPDGGLTGSAFYAISPDGSQAFRLFSSGTFITLGRYKGRTDFSGDYTSRNITFTLRNISTSDAGTYGCWNGVPSVVTSDCGQMLVVLGKPTKPSRPVPSTTPVYTEVVTLTCSSTSTSLPQGHGLTLTYRWERDGNIVTSETGTSFTFTVPSRDLQNYRCRAAESRGLESDWSDVYRMEPEYGPYQESFTPSTPSYTVRESQDNISPISCSANCKPACTFHWEKDGADIISNSAVLNLGQVSRSQTGLYRCRVSNKHGSVYTSSISVDVQYLERPVFTLDKTEVEENEAVSLTCEVDSNPAAEMVIRNVQNQTVLVERGTNSLQCTIDRVQCLHNGSFVCSADNSGVGDVSTSDEQQLNVLCKPRPDHRQPLINSVRCREGDVASLALHVISNPPPRFVWYLKDHLQLVPVPEFTQHSLVTSLHSSVLQILVQNSRDYGEYVAEVTNSVGSGQVSFTISRLDAESIPQESDRLGLGVGIGICVMIPVVVLAVVATSFFFRRRQTHHSKDVQENNVNELSVRQIREAEGDQRTYTDLTRETSAVNEYEQLQVPDGQATTYQNV